MSRVGSSLRRPLFVEVRADPPSANGIFARNVRQIDQEALLRISYFPPRPRTKKAESGRQCPNLDGALPTNVLANTFPFSLHEGRIFRNEKSGRGIRCRSIVSSKVSSSRPVHSPETLPVRFCCCREVVCDFRPLPAGANSQPFRQAERNRVYSNCRGEKWKKNSTISSSRAQSSLLELPRREMEEQSSIATAGLLTRSVCDAFPTRKSVARECRTRSLPEEGSRNIQQRELFGIHTRFPFDLLGRRLAAGFGEPLQSKDNDFFETRSRFPYFLTEKGGRRQPAASFQPHGRRRFRRLAVR